MPWLEDLAGRARRDDLVALREANRILTRAHAVQTSAAWAYSVRSYDVDPGESSAVPARFPLTNTSYTHAALLRHFPGKDELLLAALARREADEEEQAARIAEAGLAAPAVLGAVLGEEFGAPEHQRHWLALAVAATNPEHPAHAFFTGRRERMREHFRRDSSATASESIRLSADEKITLVLAMMDGLRMQALLDPSRDVLGLLRTFMELLLDTGADEPSSPSGRTESRHPA